MIVSKQQLIEAHAPRLRRRARSDRRWSNVTLGVGLTIVGITLLAALFAPWIAPYNPNAVNLLTSFEPPSWHHLMGTDNLGRDIFSRVVYAARVDFQIGLITTYVPLVTGMLVGAVAGYFGGWVDTLLMRLVDVVIAFPFLVLVIAILAIVGPGLTGLYIAVLAVGWSMYARLTRGEMLVLREQQFMLAAEALGFSRRRIIFRHAMPEPAAPEPRLLDGRLRPQHPARRVAVVPRPRRAAADAPSGARWSPKARTSC